MRLGAVFPQIESGTDPGAIRDFAQAVEAMGYSHTLVYDHIAGVHPSRLASLSVVPHTEESMFHETFVLLGFMAAVTRRLELAAAVIVLPQRETVLFAKQAAAVDVLSGGRLRLGVGVGWNPVEFAAVGANFKDRGKRMDEQISVLRMLWTQPLVDFEGRYHSLQKAGINPLPVQRPIPLWFGGSVPKALERMARFGDGLIAALHPVDGSIPDPKSTLVTIHNLMRQLGRDPASFGLEVRVKMKTPEVLVDEVTHWQRMGATHLSIDTIGGGFTHLKDHIRALEIAQGALRNAGLASL